MTTMIMRNLILLLALFLCRPAAALAGDPWQGGRGPTGLGTTDERELPITWGGPTNENVIWKAPRPGSDARVRRDHNQSSPIVWKDRVFVLAVYWPADAA